jgi:hypothetical protein
MTYLMLEDRFEAKPPDTNPYTDNGLAEELGWTPSEATRVSKSHSRKAFKRLHQLNHDRPVDAKHWDEMVAELRKERLWPILRERWARNARWMLASWDIYHRHVYNILKLGTSIQYSAVNRLELMGIDTKSLRDHSNAIRGLLPAK